MKFPALPQPWPRRRSGTAAAGGGAASQGDLRQVRRRLLINASVAALTLIILGSTTYMLLDARRISYDNAVQSVTNIALSLESDVRQTIEGLDVSLRAVAAGAGRPDLPALDVGLRQAVLFGSAVAADSLGGIIVTDEAGQVVHDSTSVAPRPLNLSSRAYFNAHRQQPDAGLLISEPLRRLRTGQWAVALTRRVSWPDGSFAGVAVALLSIEQLSTRFGKLDLGERGNISLFSLGGRIVVREPYDDAVIGRDVSNAQVYRYLRASSFGHYDAYGAVDGVHRLYAYRKVGVHSLVLAVGVPTQDIYADWAAKAAAISAAMLLLTGIAGLLTWSLKHELRRRMAAEQVARRAAHEHSAALARLSALFQNSTDAPFIVRVELDDSFVMEAINPATERLLGLTVAAVVGQGPAASLHPVMARAVLARWRACVAGREPLHYGHGLALSGGKRAWEVFTAPVPDASGRVRRLVGAACDMTERNRDAAELKRLNEDLEGRVREAVAAREAAQLRAAQAERMQILGQLAGGIAHDFNNVLQAVRGGAALIERRPEDLAAVRRLARLSIDATTRGATITRRLLAYSRQDELRAEAVDTAALLDGLGEILVHTLGSSINVRVQLETRLPPTLTDKGQLETVLLNLATNARDAMPHGGVLTLEAAGELAGPGHPAELAPGRYVRFSVTDTGAGMDAATLARVTEPFFTTKPVGKGTGLGLSMAKGFAEQSGGRFAIASQPGHGTRVDLWLPQAGAPTAGVPPAASGPAAGAGAEPAEPSLPRVLLVDDDAFVREVLAEELRGEYNVLAAASGSEALALLTAGEAVDAVVTDLSMPGIDGLALIRAVQLRRPGLPALLLTGYAGDSAALAVGGTSPCCASPPRSGR